MKPSTLRWVIGLAFLLNWISLIISDDLGSIFFPIIGVPAYALSAYVTKYLIGNKGVSRSILIGLGLLATLLAFILAKSSTDTTETGFFGVHTARPELAVIIGYMALMTFISGQAGLWFNYFANRRT